jgi:hypothetical protein
MTIEEYLESQGFEDALPGTFRKWVPGRFGFFVDVTFERFDVDRMQSVPITPEITVGLPHQCDSWEITTGTTDKAAAEAHLQVFAGEVQAARDIVAGLDRAALTVMTEAQREALQDLCDRYKVPFDPATFHARSDLPPGYVAGWIGDRIYVGCDPEGRISS